MSKRRHFKRCAIASSEGNHVRMSHRDYIREWHERNKDYIAEISLSIQLHIERKYYVKCLGKLIQITEREALMLGPELIIIK